MRVPAILSPCLRVPCLRVSVFAVIHPAPAVQPNLEDIPQHAPGVPHRIDATVGIEVPVDRDFNHLVAPPQGNEERLHVESPTGHRLLGENFLAHLIAKALEAALRILEARDRQHAHDQIEHAPHQVAIRWFAEAMRARPFPRADGDVVLCLERRQELAHLGDGHGQIRVADKQVAPAADHHAGFHRGALALLTVHDADERILRGEPLGDLGGTVATAVLHHQHFHRFRLGLDEGNDLLQRTRQPILLVIRGNDDGEQGLWFGHDSPRACDVMRDA